MIVRRAVVWVLVAGLIVGPAVGVCAQSSPQATPATTAQQPPSTPAKVDVDGLPISVDRIGRRFAQPATISLELAQPMFRVEIVETRPKWLGDIQWIPEEDRNLPVPPGTAWNREFLAMVTPQQARPFGQVKGLDLLQLVASSFAQGVATNMVVGKLKKAAERRRAAEASAEVDAAIEAWKRDRERTGAGVHAPASGDSAPAQNPAAPPD